MADDLDPAALLIAIDLVEQGGMPDQAERLRELVARVAIEHGRGQVVFRVRCGADELVAFGVLREGAPDHERDHLMFFHPMRAVDHGRLEAEEELRRLRARVAFDRDTDRARGH